MGVKCLLADAHVDASVSPFKSAIAVELKKLRKRAQFLYVRNGITVRGRYIVLQARQTTSDYSNQISFGVTATRKIGNAVVRNRAKRRLRALASEVLPKAATPQWSYVFIARHNTVLVSWSDLQIDILSSLGKLPQ